MQTRASGTAQEYCRERRRRSHCWRRGRRGDSTEGGTTWQRDRRAVLVVVVQGAKLKTTARPELLQAAPSWSLAATSLRPSRARRTILIILLALAARGVRTAVPHRLLPAHAPLISSRSTSFRIHEQHRQRSDERSSNRPRLLHQDHRRRRAARRAEAVLGFYAPDARARHRSPAD